MGFLSPETFDGAPEENREGRCLPILQRRAVAADAIGALVTSHVIPLCFLLSANFLLLKSIYFEFHISSAAPVWAVELQGVACCTMYALPGHDPPRIPTSSEHTRPVLIETVTSQKQALRHPRLHASTDVQNHHRYYRAALGYAYRWC